MHQIKHDGYRLQVRRDGETVRLFTRRGYDWSGRYSAIAVTATLLRARSFTLDGEAAVSGPDGVAVFDALHRRGTVTEAMLYAFDLLELDGEDLRGRASSSCGVGAARTRAAGATLSVSLGAAPAISLFSSAFQRSMKRTACLISSDTGLSSTTTPPFRSG